MFDGLPPEQVAQSLAPSHELWCPGSGRYCAPSACEATAATAASMADHEKGG